MNNYSILILQAYLDQNKKLKYEYKQYKNNGNWDEKERWQRSIDEVNKNIKDLEASIYTLENPKCVI